MNERLGMEEPSIVDDFNTLKLGTTLTEPLAVGTGNIHTDATQEQAEQLVEETTAYLKRVAEDAAGCCIDGRFCVHRLNGEKAILGPSVAGGPLITAYAAAELSGWFGDSNNTPLEEKLRSVKSVLEAGGIVLGAHIDTGAQAVNFVDPETGKLKTGCGADDKAPAIIDAVYDNPETVHGLSSTLLGARYQESSMTLVDRDSIRRTFQEWDPVLALEATKTPDGGNVEVLDKGHEEALVVFNYVENTTVDRDALVAATGKQVFCIDMWYIDKLASAMASGPNAAEQESQLRHAMVAYQVGTYLTLCDGSQRALLVHAA
jgi:hypothetical protein